MTRYSKEFILQQIQAKLSDEKTPLFTVNRKFLLSVQALIANPGPYLAQDVLDNLSPSVFITNGIVSYDEQRAKSFAWAVSLRPGEYAYISKYYDTAAITKALETAAHKLRPKTDAEHAHNID